MSTLPTPPSLTPYQCGTDTSGRMTFDSSLEQMMERVGLHEPQSASPAAAVDPYPSTGMTPIATPAGSGGLRPSDDCRRMRRTTVRRSLGWLWPDTRTPAVALYNRFGLYSASSQASVSDAFSRRYKCTEWNSGMVDDPLKIQLSLLQPIEIFTRRRRSARSPGMGLTPYPVR
jgi:hypothetical protein